jgi:hypothetical protein
MILNRESTRKGEKMISKAWVIIYFDKTILVLTLLRPSSSVRVVAESLGHVCDPTEYLRTSSRDSHQVRVLFLPPECFPFRSGPLLRTPSPDPLSGPPPHWTAFPDRPSTFVLSSGPPLGASHPTPSAFAPSQRFAGPPPCDVMMT